MRLKHVFDVCHACVAPRRTLVCGQLVDEG